MNGPPGQHLEALLLANQYVQALLSPSLKSSDARQVIQQALAAGWSPVALYVQVIPEALYEVGRRWERGQISVALEHIASGEAQVVLRELAQRLPRKERNGQTAIVAAVEGELHELGPRILADLLEGDGWEVSYVGAATPTEALVWLIGERQPDVVLLSATMSTQLATLADAVARARAAGPSSFIMVGGQACAGVADVARKVGADAYAARADLAMLRIRRGGSDRDRLVAAETLTRREQDVLGLLAQGLTNLEIAERLTVSVPTIKTHVEHILRKLRVRNRAEAAAFAARRSPAR